MSFKPASATKVAVPVFQNAVNFGDRGVQNQALTVPGVGAAHMQVPANYDPQIANQIRSELRNANIGQLSQYQPKVNGTAGLTDKLLEEAKGSDLPMLTNSCADIITIAKGVDIGSLVKEDGGLFGKVMSKFVNKRERLLGQFNTADKAILKVIDSVDAVAKKVASRAPMFETWHQECQNDYRALDNYIYAGKAELAEREVELQSLKVEAQASPTDLALQGRVQDLEFYIQTLGIKVAQWEVDQHDQFQMLPQIRNMQMNAVQLGQKFDTVKGRTLPGWKKKFAMVLSIDEQKRAADVIDKIDDFNNQLARDNATMLRQTTTQIATANQRLQLDVDTLQHVHDETIGTFEDLMKIVEEGKKARAELTPTLLKMKQEMVQKFTA